MSNREVVILSGVRTAIGDYGGSLKDIAPSDLGARVVREAVARAKIDPKDVGQCVIGNVIHTEAQGHVHLAPRARERRPAARHRARSR